MQPGGRNQIGGFVRLEDCGDPFRFPCDTLGVRNAVRQTSEKLAGEVFSGWLVFDHRTTR
jgi:hypothetical protein